MKRLYIAILITICGMTAMAQDRPDINHQTTGRDRTEIAMFSEVLQLQYNEDGMIEVLGCGNDYFNVTITKDLSCVWFGIIGREYGNVINYDFQTIGTYVITLTNSQGSTTVWRLENGILYGSKLPNLGEVTNQRKNDFSHAYDR